MLLDRLIVIGIKSTKSIFEENVFESEIDILALKK